MIRYLKVLSILLLVSCGYKPSSNLIKNTFDDSIYVNVIIDKIEPENAPFIKDEINRLVYTRFKSRVTTKAQSKSQIIISYSGSTFTPLSYENGYITRYLANIRVKFNMVTKKGKLTKSINAIVEADIEPSSLTSSNLRKSAIKKGLEKALDEFMGYISVKSVL